MNSGPPPHWIPTETGPRLGDPLFLSKTRARGVAEGRAGARAGGWERPSSGVKIIFTSATSVGVDTDRQRSTAGGVSVPRPGQGQRKCGQGASQARGLGLCLDKPSPAWSLSAAGCRPSPSEFPAPALRPAGTVSSFAVSTELCAAPRGAAPRPSKGTAVRGQG